MKKLVSLLLVLTTLLSFSLVSCGEKEIAPVFTGATLADNFAALETAAGINEENLPIAVGTEVLTTDMCEYMVGLTADEFTANVAEGQVTMAMMSAQAHLVSFFKVKEGVNAEEFATLLSTKFDPRRWVCVMPEKCFVIAAQDHVLLVASATSVADLYLNGFKTLAGEAAGAENVFFTGEAAE